MNNIGKWFGYIAIGAIAAFMIGVVSAWLGPDWRVDSVQGTVVTCHERWHNDHTRVVNVTKSAAAALAVNDKCPG